MHARHILLTTVNFVCPCCTQTGRAWTGRWMKLKKCPTLLKHLGWWHQVEIPQNWSSPRIKVWWSLLRLWHCVKDRAIHLYGAYTYHSIESSDSNYEHSMQLIQTKRGAEPSPGQKAIVRDTPSKGLASHVNSLASFNNGVCSRRVKGWQCR